jgi:hypothetical protein
LHEKSEIQPVPNPVRMIERVNRAVNEVELVREELHGMTMQDSLSGFIPHNRRRKPIVVHCPQRPVHINSCGYAGASNIHDGRLEGRAKARWWLYVHSAAELLDNLAPAAEVLSPEEEIEIRHGARCRISVHHRAEIPALEKNHWYVALCKSSQDLSQSRLRRQGQGK